MRDRPYRLGSAVSALAIFFALALATMTQVLREPGWPVTHEGPAFAQRTYIYARHFSWFDFLPIWSSADVSGFGSPMPLMYHKLFYLLAAPLELLSGSVKVADYGVVGALLVAGALGMYSTVRAIGASRLAAIVGGCSLIAANYTVTNWLVRGALAEFCGAMLVPWVLFFFIRSVQRGRVSLSLGVLLGLLWLSHSVLAFYAGLILAAAYLLMVVFRLAPWQLIDPRTAWPAAAAFTLIVLPYLVPMIVLRDNYEFSRILSFEFSPAFQFKPLQAYLWETQWRFGRTVSGLTIQLDLPILVLLAAGIVAVVVRPAETLADSKRAIAKQALPFLLLAGIGCLLQHPATAAFYEWVPGAAYIQFPWRLLALITPALIVAAVYLADVALPADIRLFLLGATAAWMIASCGAFARLQDPRMLSEPALVGLQFSGFREYEPKSAAPLGEIVQKVAQQWTAAACSYENLTPDNEEVPAARFGTMCPVTTILPLPVYASSLHSVTTAARPSSPCLSSAEFPALCGAAIPAGQSIVSIQMPNAKRFWKWMVGIR